MESPIKGLERISEELKTERQKLGIVNQDRTRLRLEAENYKQIIEQQKYEIQELNETVEELQKEVASSNSKLSTLQQQFDLLEGEMQNKSEQYQEWLHSSDATSNRISTLEDVIYEREEEVKALRIHIETMESKVATKDSLVATLKAELLELRKAHAALEHQRLDTHKQLAEQEALNEELQVRLQLADVSGSGHALSTAVSEELRSELEQSLQLNTTLNQQVRELNDRIHSKASNERQLNESVQHLQAERERLLNEVNALQQSNQDLLQSLQAEVEARVASNQHCDTVVRNREFLDQQMDELREEYKEMQHRNLQLESDLLQCGQRLRDALVSIEEKDSYIEQLSAKAHKADDMMAMSIELDNLRSQLVQLRKQMIKRDLEDQAGVLPPKAILDRENHGRTVYEGIIQELRGELEKMTAKHDEMLHKYDLAMERAGKVDLLEEELAIYKEMAHTMSQESQTVTIAASEAAERSMKNAHERQHILHELHVAETANHSAQLENKRLKDEIATLKEKVKQFHTEKLAADKRATESFAINSRTETLLEELRKQYDVLHIEHEKSQRVIHEYTFQINDLKKKESELVHLRAEFEQQARVLEAAKTGKMLETEEQLQEGQRAKQQRDLLRQEVESLKIKLRALETDLDKQIALNDKLSEDLEEALHEKERYKTQIIEEEQSRVEHQMAELKRDLAYSLTEWKDLEKEKGIKDSLIQQLQADFALEKQRTTALLVQVAHLEEKIKRANDELKVYRGIDVYHSSLNAELRSYREEKVVAVREDRGERDWHDMGGGRSRFLAGSAAAGGTARMGQEPPPPPAKPMDMSGRSLAGSRRLSLEEIDEPSVQETDQRSELDSSLFPPPPYPLPEDGGRGEVRDRDEPPAAVDAEERRRQELLMQRSLRKAAREQQIRQQLLEEERQARTRGSAEAKSSMDPPPRPSAATPTPATTPLKAKLHSQQALQQSAPLLSLRSGVLSSGTLAASGQSGGHKAAQRLSHSTTAPALSSSPYLKASGLSSSQYLRNAGANSQSMSALSKAKQELERARRLISM